MVFPPHFGHRTSLCASHATTTYQTNPFGRHSHRAARNQPKRGGSRVLAAYRDLQAPHALKNSRRRHSLHQRPKHHHAAQRPQTGKLDFLQLASTTARCRWIYTPQPLVSRHPTSAESGCHSGPNRPLPHFRTQGTRSDQQMVVAGPCKDKTQRRHRLRYLAWSWRV